MRRRRSPQEKKQLSYARDCRNRYSANDKASRKCLPRKRARVHRANRHHAHQALLGATGPVDANRADVIEERASGRQQRAFIKIPDMPLGEFLQRKSAARRERAADNRSL